MNIYIPEEIEIKDNISIQTRLRSEDCYIGLVYEKVKDGNYNIKKQVAQVVAYFDRHSTMEDARPYWTIQYFVKAENKNKELMQNMIDILIQNKIIYEPVWIHDVVLSKVEHGETLRIQKGKIFPDDEADAAGDEWVQNQIDQQRGK